MLQKPLYLARMKTLKGYVYYCLLKGLKIDRASHDKHPIQSCQEQSVQSSRECFCISVVFIYLFSAPRPIEPLGLIDGKRFWLLPGKHDWRPWDGGEPARILLSLLDVRRAPRWQRVDMFENHTWRRLKALSYACNTKQFQMYVS